MSTPPPHSASSKLLIFLSKLLPKRFRKWFFFLLFFLRKILLKFKLTLFPRPRRQEAYIAEREEAWSKVEKLAIQSPHYHKLARPEVITAPMVFPRIEPMETVPERLNLPPREPQEVGPSVPEGVGPGVPEGAEPERQMEVGTSDIGGSSSVGEGGGAEGTTVTTEGGGEDVIHNVEEGEGVELNVQVDEVKS